MACKAFHNLFSMYFFNFISYYLSSSAMALYPKFDMSNYLSHFNLLVTLSRVCDILHAHFLAGKYSSDNALTPPLGFKYYLLNEAFLDFRMQLFLCAIALTFYCAHLDQSCPNEL